MLDVKWLRSLEKSLFTQLRWPVKMGKPCSQLNSKVRRDKVECHIVVAIEKTCSFFGISRVTMKKFSKPGIGSAKREMNVIWNCQNWARFAFFFWQ